MPAFPKPIAKTVSIGDILVFQISLFCDYCNDLLRIQWLIKEACLVKLFTGRRSRPPPVERPPHFLALSEKHLHWGPFNWFRPRSLISGKDNHSEEGCRATLLHYLC